jgi:hypothetical protein
MAWATFWANFSPTHLVTLGRTTYMEKCTEINIFMCQKKWYGSFENCLFSD